MSWCLIPAGLICAVLVAFVWLRIAALVAIERILQAYFAWEAKHPEPTSEEVRGYFRQRYSL